MAKRKFTKYPQLNVMASDNKEVWAASNTTTKFSNELVQKIRDEGFGYIIDNSMDSLDTSIVEALLYSAIYSKNLDYLLYLITQNEYNSIRLAQHLGGNPNAPEEVLETLWSKYSDTYESVVWKVVQNPNVPKYILEEALDSPFRSIRAIAENRLNSDVNACDNITASTGSSSGSDFTVIQNIYSDGTKYMTEDNVMPVYSQEYDVDMDEVLARYPRIFDGAMKGWTDETFESGDILTENYAAFGFIKRIIGEEQMYSDYKDYVAHHPEFSNPSRQIEIRINNPSCLPSAEDQRRRNSEELGKRLGKMLGLGRY